MQPPPLTQHMVAPPPLPAYLGGAEAAGAAAGGGGGSQRSALAVGLIGLVCLLTLLIVYCRFFSRYCTACDTAGTLSRTGSRADGFWAIFPAAAAASAHHQPAAAASAWRDPPPVGLPAHALSLVPMLKFHKVPATNSHHHHHHHRHHDYCSNITKDCAVCLSPFQDADDVRLLPLRSHIFHGACIDAWLLSRVTCPMCRTPVFQDLTKILLPSPTAAILLTVEPC